MTPPRVYGCRARRRPSWVLARSSDRRAGQAAWQAATEREVSAVSGTQSQHAAAGRSTDGSGQESVSELVQRASQQLTELVRGELRLAQAEIREKGRHYG